MSGRPAAPLHDPWLGQEIEGFRLTRVVGQGGMGRIYEAVQVDIGPRAAIKLLYPEHCRDEDATARFFAEARAASAVHHPAVVKIFSHGRLPDGTAYLVMEYLPGESLEERLLRLRAAGQRMSIREAVRLTAQVASALAAVHRAGVVHRDLKPANLLTCADPEVQDGERVKIVDFGIAKFTADETDDVGRTTIGRFLGTALYASPEQCRMAGRVDERADVYALGVILYEMLAGRPPFMADTPGEVISMHLLQAPPPLWDQAKEAPDLLCRLVHEMLAKDPAERPSMELLAAGLSQTPLVARRGAQQRGARRGAERRPWIVAGGLALLVGVGIGARLLRTPPVRSVPPAVTQAAPRPSGETPRATTPAPAPAVAASPAVTGAPSHSGSAAPPSRGDEAGARRGRAPLPGRGDNRGASKARGGAHRDSPPAAPPTPSPAPAEPASPPRTSGPGASSDDLPPDTKHPGDLP